jgi:hypothetical protein
MHAALHEQLSPALYTIALALRCNQLPTAIRPQLPLKCDCHDMLYNNQQLIEHAIGCDKMSGITPGARHTFVKVALKSTASAYGILVHNEPNFYVYGSEVRHRPDLTFNLYSESIATDVTIVTASGRPGDAAAAAAKKKTEHHSAAVNAFGHEFIPFAMETSGHLDSSCHKLIDRIAQHIPRHERHWFKRDMTAAASTAVAKFRALAVRAATHDNSLGLALA